MNANLFEHDSTILTRLVDLKKPSFSPEAAKGILVLQFNDADRERMHALAAKSRAGELTEDEQAEAESYQRVGSLLALLQSKARISLQQFGSDGHK